jgi:hypothetical protein
MRRGTGGGCYLRTSKPDQAAAERHGVRTVFFLVTAALLARIAALTLMVRIGNGRAGVLADAAAKLNVLLSEMSAEGELFHRAQELRLERAHIPLFPLFWTLMHVLDARSPLHGYDMARAIEADARVFVLSKRAIRRSRQWYTRSAPMRRTISASACATRMP